MLPRGQSAKPSFPSSLPKGSVYLQVVQSHISGRLLHFDFLSLRDIEHGPQDKPQFVAVLGVIGFALAGWHPDSEAVFTLAHSAACLDPLPEAAYHGRARALRREQALVERRQRAAFDGCDCRQPSRQRRPFIRRHAADATGKLTECLAALQLLRGCVVFHRFPFGWLTSINRMRDAAAAEVWVRPARLRAAMI